MNNTSPNTPPYIVLEFALHAMVSERCKHAYLHDLRNGMQGVSGGFEVLKRLLKNSSTAAPAAAAVEKSTDMVRRSLTGHEESLQRIADQLIPEAGERVPLRVDELLRDLVKFLNSDAAAHEVSLEMTVDASLRDAGLTITARQRTQRLALLSLLVDAIDSMPSGGQLQLASTIDSGSIVVGITATPAQGALQRNYATIWELNLAAQPVRDGLLFYVVRQLVANDGGTIEFAPIGDGSKATIRYPMTQST